MNVKIDKTMHNAVTSVDVYLDGCHYEITAGEPSQVGRRRLRVRTAGQPGPIVIRPGGGVNTVELEAER